MEKGWWNSIHVFDVSAEGSKKNSFVYKLTSTVMVSLGFKDDATGGLGSPSSSSSVAVGKLGEVDLSGSMTKQTQRTMLIDDSHGSTHISNLGSILEDAELAIRNEIEGIYIQKTREVINGMRSTEQAKDKNWDLIAASLGAAVMQRGKQDV